jgi:hypothetical protein
MRRFRRLSRPLDALFALWFAIVLGDPGVLHACPMHGGHGGHGGTHAAAAHVGHEMHGGAQATATSASDEAHHDAAPACTCVGHCCAASSVAPVPPVAAVYVPNAVAEARAPLSFPSTDVPASPDFRLPFANGPPTA